MKTKRQKILILAAVLIVVVFSACATKYDLIYYKEVYVTSSGDTITYEGSNLKTLNLKNHDKAINKKAK